jgi:SAM-dependent methyltransferase
MSYESKVEQEISVYKDVLDVHALPEIFSYWSNKHLRPKFESLGFSNPNQFFVDYISQRAALQSPSDCKILSVGAGNCDTEVNLAQSLIQKGIKHFCFDCLDLNSEMLARGQSLASEQGLSPHFGFIEADINGWTAEESYHVIIANQSLHHFVELELLFDKIWRSLAGDGVFLTNDMIGRNGHMRWPEALELVQACWSLLDEKHKWNHQLKRLEPVYENWDCSTSGFEGIRAQDILPLLITTFRFDSFIGFGNLINVFVDRAFGHNFDPASPRDRHFIDFVSGLDDYFIETGTIKPTQMIAAMTKHSPAAARYYKHLTPKFCVRDPNLVRPAVQG